MEIRQRLNTATVYTSCVNHTQSGHVAILYRVSSMCHFNGFSITNDSNLPGNEGLLKSNRDIITEQSDTSYDICHTVSGDKKHIYQVMRIGCCRKKQGEMWDLKGGDCWGVRVIRIKYSCLPKLSTIEGSNP